VKGLRRGLFRARNGMAALALTSVLSLATHVRPAIRPIEASRAANRDVRFTSILLKNSNFCVDHNSEDRWQPRWKIP
jgi:hypothetical protein